MSFGKGIPLASGFDLGAKSPLDSRITVETLEERDLHVTGNRAYEGMLVFVTQEDTLYRYSKGEWKIIPTRDELVIKSSELDNDINFTTRDEVTYLIENDECTYIGSDMPENKDLIWFTSSYNDQQTPSYEDAIIKELFTSLRSLQQTVEGLQQAVVKLQEDVEYLKIYGGSGGIGGGGDEENKLSTLALEDGSLFLLEDGGLLLLENAIEQVQKALLLLEDGAEFLLEDGSSILLEKQDVIPTDEDLILLEDGSEMLLEDGSSILLEIQSTPTITDERLVLLENGGEMLLENEKNIILE